MHSEFILRSFLIDSDGETLPVVYDQGRPTIIYGHVEAQVIQSTVSHYKSGFAASKKS